MVFNRLAAGFLCGVAFPMICHETIYMFLASSFLRPHLVYRQQQQHRHKDLAVSTDDLDRYLKDIFKSALFFVLASPWVFYKVYWQKVDVMEPEEEDTIVEDKAAEVLKQHKADQVITFEDYEKFMH